MTATTTVRRLDPGDSIGGCFPVRPDTPLWVVLLHVLAVADDLGVEPIGELVGAKEHLPEWTGSRTAVWKLTGTDPHR